MAAFISVSVEGIGNLREKLERRIQKARTGDGSAKAGYSAPYALFVHEDLEKHHPIGQAKFLETPARQSRTQLAATVLTNMGRGKTMDQANYEAAKQLLELSERLVPVETGTLKASGFVEDKYGHRQTAIDLGLAEAPRPKKKPMREEESEEPTEENGRTDS